MLTQHPGIHLHLVENSGGHLLELLGLGRLDMSVHSRESEAPRIARQLMVDEAFFLVGDLPGAEAGTECPLTALDGFPLLLPSAAHGVRLVGREEFLSGKTGSECHRRCRLVSHFNWSSRYEASVHYPAMVSIAPRFREASFGAAPGRAEHLAASKYMLADAGAANGRGRAADAH